MAQCAVLGEALGLPRRQRAISWLPMAHIAERLCTHYIPMHLGWTVTSLADPRGVGGLLPEVRPQFFFSPPRLWEKMRAATIAKLGDRPDGATELAALGLGEVRVAVTGAAPCPAEVTEFWNGLGLPLCEVYGMSETTGVATVNTPDAVRIGTVGRPLPGVEVALSDAGEVLMRGPVVMRGYRNRPDATAEALDADTLDPEAAATVGDPHAEVAAQIDRANERLARAEQIKRFALLPVDWVADGDELTPTMKLKRKPIAEKYAAEIEALYA